MGLYGAFPMVYRGQVYFHTCEKIKHIADVMGITPEELNMMRVDTRRKALARLAESGGKEKQYA